MTAFRYPLECRVLLNAACGLGGVGHLTACLPACLPATDAPEV